MIDSKELFAATYRVRDACANCRHVFVRQEHEGNDEL